jgi:hypothetical protein
MVEVRVEVWVSAPLYAFLSCRVGLSMFFTVRSHNTTIHPIHVSRSARIMNRDRDDDTDELPRHEPERFHREADDSTLRASQEPGHSPPFLSLQQMQHALDLLVAYYLASDFIEVYGNPFRAEMNDPFTTNLNARLGLDLRYPHAADRSPSFLLQQQMQHALDLLVADYCASDFMEVYGNPFSSTLTVHGASSDSIQIFATVNPSFSIGQGTVLRARDGHNHELPLPLMASPGLQSTSTFQRGGRQVYPRFPFY